MRLLVIFPTEFRGGNEEYALTIADAAVQKGWQVHAAFPKGSGTLSLVQSCTDKHISYHPLQIAEGPNRNAGSKVLDILRLVRTVILLLKVKPDVIHLCLPWPDLCFGSIVACALLKIPTTVVFQLVPPATFMFNSKKLEIYAWARKRQQQWVSVSENNRKLLCESFLTEVSEIQCIYNGASIPLIAENDSTQDKKTMIRSRIRHQLGLSQDSRIVLTVARLHPQKGYEDLVPALPYITKEFPDLHFVWVGEGELKPFLQRKLQEYDVKEKVLVLGCRDDVPSLLQAADLFVFPTRFEGLPFSLIEAMAYGVPVLSSNASSIPELITHEETGLLFRVGDSCHLLETLRWAMKNPQRMQEMADRALAYSQNFSRQKMVDATLNVFEQRFSE